MKFGFKRLNQPHIRELCKACSDTPLTMSKQIQFSSQCVASGKVRFGVSCICYCSVSLSCSTCFTPDK